MEILLEAENLGKDYGPLRALDSVSFCLKEGEILGLLGHNGAGKSTCLECLLGSKKRSRGSVKLLGQEPEHAKRSLYEDLGVQFQHSAFQEKLRVAEACELSAALYKKPADWKLLLQDFDLTAYANKDIKELSGGQKQILSLILSLIPQAKLLFLDELSTGLDPHARHKVWDYLKQLVQAGCGILLSSHFMDEAEYLCDRVLILKQGRPLALNTPRALIEQEAVKNLEEVFLKLLGTDPEASQE